VTLTTLDVATIAAATAATAVTALCEGFTRRTGVHAAVEGVAVAGVRAADHDDGALAAATVSTGSRSETDAEGTQRTCQ
jgi:hypothetical protein